MKPRQRPSPETLENQIRQGDRLALARAITLCESNLSSDRQLAGQLLDRLRDCAGASYRIGITGVPGVGKSTFIEAFGQHLIQAGKNVAVLAIDPTSKASRGSILGDKTRMEQLTRSEKAFIRPSPAGKSLGGITHRTRESLLLCEAAGYEVVLVETVGVGQSETEVKEITDVFLLLMLAGAGDELQGIKRGIMEMAELLLIHKADGPNLTPAKSAAKEYENALHLFPPHPAGITPGVKLVSSLESSGIAEAWQWLEDFRQKAQSSGYWQQNRQRQEQRWFEQTLLQELLLKIEQDTGLQSQSQAALAQIAEGKLSPYGAIFDLLNRLQVGWDSSE